VAGVLNIRPLRDKRRLEHREGREFALLGLLERRSMENRVRLRSQDAAEVGRKGQPGKICPLRKRHRPRRRVRMLVDGRGRTRDRRLGGRIGRRRCNRRRRLLHRGSGLRRLCRGSRPGRLSGWRTGRRWRSRNRLVRRRLRRHSRRDGRGGRRGLCHRLRDGRHRLLLGSEDDLLGPLLTVPAAQSSRIGRVWIPPGRNNGSTVGNAHAGTPICILPQALW
jgi:hypothetical protein